MFFLFFVIFMCVICHVLAKNAKVQGIFAEIIFSQVELRA